MKSQRDIYFLSVWSLMILWTMCGCEESEEERNLKSLRERQMQIAKQRAELSSSKKNAEKKRAERDAKGDTVALSSASLEKFLPEVYENYKKQGEAINSPAERNGNAFSSIEQTYSTGVQNIRIVIRDSNQGVSSHAGVGKVWAKTPPINNRKVQAGYLKIQQCNAWQYFEKRTKRAGLQIEVSDRIYIEVLATEQTDTAHLNGFISQIDLKALTKI